MSALPQIEGAQQGTTEFLGPELTLLTFEDFGERPVIRCHQSICNMVEMGETGQRLIAFALRVDGSGLAYFMDAELARKLAAQLLAGADLLDLGRGKQ